jgi:hypothetical protein
MRFKFKALVLAAALSASFSMNASADLATGTNGELVFTVYTLLDGKETSWALDTGVTLSAFNAGVLTSTPYSFNTDANYTSWYAGLDAGQKSSLQWNLMAVDTTGTQNYLTTMTSTIVGVTSNAAQTNGDYFGAIAGWPFEQSNPSRSATMASRFHTPCPGGPMMGPPPSAWFMLFQLTPSR